MDRNKYITASELGDYTYCKRSWWLKKQGLYQITYAMKQGTQHHENLVNQLLNIKLVHRVLIYLGIFLLIMLIVILVLL